MRSFIQRHILVPAAFLTSLFFCLCAGLPVAADFIIVPNELAAAEGNVPSQFLTGAYIFASVRYQQVFAGSQFSGVGRITEIAFRPDAVHGIPFSTTLSNVRIGLSTTLRAPDGLSATFADNVGIDDTVVFSGNLTLTSADVPGPDGTRAFDILIGLTTPFIYDPSLGNLLFDFQRDTSPLDPFGVSFNAHDQTGDSISRAYGSRTSLTAFNVDSTGLVARFTVTAVPEPAFYQMAFLFGLGSLYLLRRRR
jgi:hypothetical protein